MTEILRYGVTKYHASYNKWNNQDSKPGSPALDRICIIKFTLTTLILLVVINNTKAVSLK